MSHLENLKDRLNKTRKHAELIKAWAEGADIQVRYDKEWTDVENPRWANSLEYRVKPKEPEELVCYYYVNSNTNIYKSDASGAAPDFKIVFDAKTHEVKRLIVKHADWVPKPLKIETEKLAQVTTQSNATILKKYITQGEKRG
jgi:hypothetical protein